MEKAIMKTITFAIQKGGTGKTSTAVSVAVELAESGHSVIFIDADPQGNATSWIGIEELQYELVDVLMKKCDVQTAIKSTKVENLSYLPTASVGGLLKTYSKTLANGSPFSIKHILKEIREKFDFCIIDTSPSFGALEEACLLASDEAIAVLKFDEFSKEGLISFIDNIQNLKERYDTEKPLLKKLVLNSRDLRLSQQQFIIDEIMSYTSSEIFTIPVDQTFTKAQQIHYPIQYLDTLKKQTAEVIKSLAISITKE